MAFADLVQLSATSYVQDLAAARARQLPPAVDALAAAIVDTTNAALALGPSVSPARISLSLPTLQRALAVSPTDCLALANRCSLGLGSSTPAVLIIGKEPAINANIPENLLLESLALTALWACGGSRTSVDALLAQPVSYDRFLTHPAGLPVGSYPAVAQKTGHTWHKIGKLLAAYVGRTITHEAWGEYAFITDLNADGALLDARAAPDKTRRRFLEDLVADFAQEGTRTLILHSQNAEHAPTQRLLVAAFLDVAAKALGAGSVVNTAPNPTRSQTIEIWDANHRRVIRCRHLSNSVSDAFLSQLAGLML